VRKVKEGETTNDLFAFLTTEPNAIVAPIHAKAMPVILTTQEEIDAWMTAPAPKAFSLQRPLPGNSLQIVARGHEIDGLPNRTRGPCFEVRSFSAVLYLKIPGDVSLVGHRSWEFPNCTEGLFELPKCSESLARGAFT
jgi:hypothetical protein